MCYFIVLNDCNADDRFGKKEAGTGEHLNTFNQINKHKWKPRPGPLSSSTVVTPPFIPSGAPPWDSRPVSGAGVVHYHSLHRPRSVPTALGPAPLVTYPHRPSQAGGYSRDCALLPPLPPLPGGARQGGRGVPGGKDRRGERKETEGWGVTETREGREEKKKKNLGPVPGHTAARSSTSWAVHSRCHAMVLDLFGGRPDAHPPPGGRRWLLRSRAAGSESPVPCSSPNMADGSRLRPPGERGDSSAPSRTAATPPRPRSTAASLPSHLFFFCSSTTASGSHWRSPPLPAARSSQHRDPTQQRGLSDSVSLLPPGFRHQCNAVRIYGKKEAGTGEHLNTFNQINKHKWKPRPGPLSSSTVVTPPFIPSGAPPWDSRPVSGAGVVHYHSLHRPRSVPTALGPAPLVTMTLLLFFNYENCNIKEYGYFWKE